MQIDSQTRLDEFLHQFEEEHEGARVKIHLAEEGKAAGKDSRFSPLETFRALFKHKEQPVVSSSGNRVLSLLTAEDPQNKNIGGKKKNHHNSTRDWWLSFILWMTVLFFIGFTLTVVFQQLGKDLSWEVVYGVIKEVWLVLIFPAVLASLKAFFDRQNKNEQEPEEVPGMLRLDDVVNNRRVEMDQVVRQQCDLSLSQSAEVLNQVRSKVFKQGNSALALKLRDLEQTVSRARDKIADPAFGRPAYLDTNLSLDTPNWLRRVDDEEDLLLYAAALSEKALVVQQELTSAEEMEIAIPEIEKHLNGFLYQFGERARLLKALEN
jgi:hypothetical protein